MFSQFFPKSNSGPTPVHLDYRLVFLASCLISLWLIAIDPIANRDAIIYLRTADAYLQDGLFASQSLFDRPFLPVIFALVHKITGMPLLWAGQLVVTLFYAILAVSFVATVRTMGGDRRVQLLAAVIILSHPILNANRSDIIRDPAYWAMTLLSFRQLLLYTRSPELVHQVLWFTFISLACLFRFEGLFFLVFAPLGVLLTGAGGSRWRYYSRLMILPCIAIAALSAFILFYQAYLPPDEQLFPDIRGYIGTFMSASRKIQVLSVDSAQSWLAFTSKEDATIAALGGLSTILVVNICRAITWPYVAVLLLGRVRKLYDRVNPRDRVLIRTHLIICLLYLALFLVTKQFMLERYSGILTIFLLLYLPFIFNSVWSNGEKQGGKILVSLLLVGMSLDSLHNQDYKKAFIGDATEWLLNHTPAQATLVTNSSYIAYFSQREFTWSKEATEFTVEDLQENPQRWQQTDYLVLLVKKDQRARLQQFIDAYSLNEIKVFPGKRHGKISIIKIGQGAE